jgi:hypothetical protein
MTGPRPCANVHADRHAGLRARHARCALHLPDAPAPPPRTQIPPPRGCVGGPGARGPCEAACDGASGSPGPASDVRQTVTSTSRLWRGELPWHPVPLVSRPSPRRVKPNLASNSATCGAAATSMAAPGHNPNRVESSRVWSSGPRSNLLVESTLTKEAHRIRSNRIESSHLV